jgi:hypothetical protein
VKKIILTKMNVLNANQVMFLLMILLNVFPGSPIAQCMLPAQVNQPHTPALLVKRLII